MAIYNEKILRALALVCALVFAAYASAQTQLETANFKINQISLTAEIADEAHERIRGLSFRTQLQPDSGMLFVYNHERNLMFTMRDTAIPLSIAFLDKNMVITEILPMTPFTDGPYPSSKPAQFALEMEQGWFKRNDIKPGDKLMLSRK